MAQKQINTYKGSSGFITMKVKCPKCNHEWDCKSKLIYTTCSSCQRKMQISTNTIETRPKDEQ